MTFGLTKSKQWSSMKLKQQKSTIYKNNGNKVSPTMQYYA